MNVEDEPELWRRSPAGEIDLWVDFGQLDERRIRKACGRAREVIVYTYARRKAETWWKQVAGKLERFDNLSVRHLGGDRDGPGDEGGAGPGGAVRAEPAPERHRAGRPHAPRRRRDERHGGSDAARLSRGPDATLPGASRGADGPPARRPSMALASSLDKTARARANAAGAAREAAYPPDAEDSPNRRRHRR